MSHRRGAGGGRPGRGPVSGLTVTAGPRRNLVVLGRQVHREGMFLHNNFSVSAREISRLVEELSSKTLKGRPSALIFLQ